ncbi:MAG: hypothetical protein V1797_19985 [Pseudomonadota bacterium]
MASEIDDLSIEYEEDGELVVEQLDKLVLNRGAWTTVLFLYRERDAKTGEFGPAKAGLRRYQKSKGEFRKRDAINLTEKTTPLLIDKLKEWFKL